MQRAWLGPTLPLALEALATKVHLVGVSDEYSTSLCLFMVRLGVVTRDAFQGGFCDCEASPEGVPWLESKRVKTAADRPAFWSVTPPDIAKMAPYLADDFDIFGHAWNMFRRQIEAAESKMGGKLLCEAQRNPAHNNHPMASYIGG